VRLAPSPAVAGAAGPAPACRRRRCGSLPVAYLAGGGGTALVLDARQREEFLLTAAQSLLGVAALMSLRFPRWLALTLLGLFAAPSRDLGGDHFRDHCRASATPRRHD
jgi:hypothetical protein